MLNYGHTLAHALEIETDYAIAHGEAVAIGLIYAAHLARRLGRIDRASSRTALRRRRRQLRAGHVRCRMASTHRRLIALMGRDKKALGDGLTFVLDGPEGVEVVQ